MILTIKGLSRNGKTAIFTGAAQNIRIPLGAFPSKQAPASFEVDNGTFAAPRQPKVKLTAEERRAARAAAPKPTLAEKIARREAQLVALKAKLAAEL